MQDHTSKQKNTYNSKSESESSGGILSTIFSPYLTFRRFVKNNGVASFSDARTQNELLYLTMAMGVFSILQRAKPWHKPPTADTLGFTPRIQDHPFVAYMIENLTMVGLVSLALKVFPAGTMENEFEEEVVVKIDGNGASAGKTVIEKRKKALWRVFLLRYLHSVGRMCFLSDLGHQIIKVYCEKLYDHRPYFSMDAPPPDTSSLLAKEYFGTNFPMYIAFGIIEAGFADVTNWMFNPPKKVEEESTTASTNNNIIENKQSGLRKLISYLSTSPVLASLVKLAMMRAGVDLAFYYFHKTLHSEPFYKSIHFYHHQHNNPRLHTNYHFTIIDLIVESVLPILVSFAGTNLLFGASYTALERLVFTYYLGLFELASHSGKEYPVVTWFPPLSPLLNYFWEVDKDDVLFHTTHHMIVFCNYSISKWPDKLFGTFKLVTPDYVKS